MSWVIDASTCETIMAHDKCKLPSKSLCERDDSDQGQKF